MNHSDLCLVFPIQMIHLCANYFVDFPSGQTTHVDLVNAGLEVISNNALSGTSLESVRFLDNKISFIDPEAFRSALSIKSLKEVS